MSEYLSNRAPLEERVFRFAAAAMLAGLKQTTAATRRCRQRKVRAIRALERGDGELFGIGRDQAAADAAAAWLARHCDVCRRCPGVELMRRRQASDD